MLRHFWSNAFFSGRRRVNCFTWNNPESGAYFRLQETARPMMAARAYAVTRSASIGA